MNPPNDSAELFSRYTSDDLADLAMETVDQLIARVLRRAHRAAIAAGAPDEARAILNVAESFADELATADSGFDRLAFIGAVTGYGS